MNNLKNYITKVSMLLVFMLGGITLMAGSISGPPTVVSGVPTTYYTSGISNKCGNQIQWDIGTGGQMISQGTHSITIVWDCADDPYQTTVRGFVNGCSLWWTNDTNLDEATLNVTVTSLNPIADPISGKNTVCDGSTTTYTTPLVTYGSNYVWTLSNGGGTITTPDPLNPNSIEITWDDISDPTQSLSTTLTVTPQSGPGCDGTPSDLPITVENIIGFGISSSPGLVCGLDDVTYVVTPDFVSLATSHIWGLPVGVNVISGDEITNILHFDPYAQSGDITVTSMYECGTGFSTSVPVVVTVLPYPPSTIQGPIAVCINDVKTYGIEEIGNLEPGDYYEWTITGGTPATTTTTVPELDVTWTTDGTGTISVRGHNQCGYSPSSSSIDVIVHPTSTATIVKNTVFNHTELASLTPDYLYFNHCTTSGSCSNKVIDKATLLVEFNTGEDYNYGAAQAFNTSVKVQIIGYADVDNLGLHVVDQIIELAIDQSSPEQSFQLDFKDEYYQIQSFEILILEYNEDAFVESTVQLTAEYLEEFSYNALTVDPLVVATSIVPVSGSNQYELNWSNIDCSDFLNYEVQVLRLFNKEHDDIPAPFDNTIDWNQALSIETQSSAKSIILTLAEGTGAYVWRVRPIGNYEGGIENDQNWGVWSDHSGYEQEDVISLPVSSFPYTLDYIQFNEDINWIYSRTFTEGNISDNQQVRIGENISFANGLQQVKQTQAHLSTNDNILTTQTVNDYAGRPALTTMPVPLKNKTSLGFEPDFLKKDINTTYTAADFDGDLNYNDPETVYDNAGEHFDYYSDANTDLTIPSAEAYPFTRTLFYNDGNSRVKEQSGVGATFKINPNPSLSKTNRTFYAGIADEELIRVFGDEAPLNTSVHKVINVDGNNTTTVTYIGKDGKTLATCLASNGQNEYEGETDALMGLKSQEDGDFTVVDVIDNTTPFGDYGNQATTTRTFVDPSTTVHIHYDITPEIVEEICLDYCNTCDYYVEIIVQNVEEPTIPVFYREELLPSGVEICGGTITTLQIIGEDIILPMGTYSFTKRVVANNTDGSTVIIPTNPIGSTYFEIQVQEVRDLYEDEIYGATGDLVAVNAFLDAPEPDINGLYTFLGLNLNEPENLPETVAIPLQIAGCSTSIEIPVILCPEKLCPAIGNSVSFADDFDDFWEAARLEDPSIPVITFIGAQGASPAYTNASFDLMVQNMVTDGYDCEELLWECWTSTTQSYQELEALYATTGIPASLTLNVVDAFLDCAGRRITSFTSNPQDAIDYAYKTFYYIEGTKLLCEELFEDNTNGCTISNFDNCSNAALQYDFYKCVTTFNPDAFPVPEEDPYLAAQAMTDTCELYCEYKRAGFTAAIVDAFHQNQEYVAANPDVSGTALFPYSGDIYQLEYVGLINAGTEDEVLIDLYQFNDLLPLPSETEFVSWTEVECMTEALVDNCKSGCTITVVLEENGPGEDDDQLVMGTLQEQQAFQNSFVSAYEVSIPSQGEQCEDNWSTISNTVSIIRDSVFISSTPITGGVINIYDIITTTITKAVNITTCVSILEVTETITGCETEAGCQSTFVTLQNPETCETDESIACEDGWAKEYGGTALDILYDIDNVTSNIVGPHGSLILGTSYSSDGDVSNNHGAIDAWGALLHEDGGIEWEKSFGGSQNDYLVDFWETNTNDMLTYVGYSNSSDGDLSGYTNQGGFDFWILATDLDGTILFNKSFGDATDNKLLGSEAVANGVIAVGSNDGKGYIVRMNDNGVMDWQHTFTQGEYLNQVKLTSDGYYVAVGEKNSDQWVVKFEDDGTILWDNTYGGSGVDYAMDVANLGGKYYVAGNTSSTSGDFGIKDNSVDYTLLELDNLGAILNANTFGGSGNDVLNAISSYGSSTSGFNVYLTGTSWSDDGDVIGGSTTIEQTWVIRTNPTLTIQNSTIISEVGSKSRGINTWQGRDLCLRIGYTIFPSGSYYPDGADYGVTKLCNGVPCDCEHRDFCFRYIDWPTIPEEVEEILPVPCEVAAAELIKNSIEQSTYEYIEAQVEAYKNNYSNTCVDPENINDNFWISYQLGYHHYTLYYYNRAGNLMQTVPPQGVDLLDVDNTADAFDVSMASPLTRALAPNHRFTTDYEYNSLGQLVVQTTPDGGTTNFYYNSLGQLRFSQNAAQLATILSPSYSYTLYDKLGRIIEVGESTQAGLAGDFHNLSNTNTEDFPDLSSDKSEVTYTVYTTLADDITYLNDGTTTQEYLQNRVSYTFTDEDGFLENTTENQTFTYYSYDPHGNVQWMVQDIPGFLDKQYLRYEYDLVSGNVLKVCYNEGRMDQFYHRYTYDADNRIILAETSKNNITWDKDAGYEYYAHGPLKRTEIGEDNVQGLDYVYTIHGWLKALNHPSLDKTLDPGTDGNYATNNFAKDVFAMQLGYFTGDFNRTGSQFNENGLGVLNPAVNRDLYNGNISTWTSNNHQHASSADPYPGLTGFQYRYDELNRLRTSDFKENVSLAGFGTSLNAYSSSYSYDANGNLYNLNRNGNPTEVAMDALTYYYYDEAGGIYDESFVPAMPTNKLAYVDDGVLGSSYLDDLEAQVLGNYNYDEIGNLIEDSEEDIAEIKWTVYGKIKEVIRTTGSPRPNLKFVYDASGNRIAKIVIPDVTDEAQNVITWYSRDASGNVMAIYESEFENTPEGMLEKIYLTEEPIYGSSRIGEYKKRTLLKIVDEPIIGLPTESLASLNAKIAESTNVLIGVQKPVKISHPLGGFSVITPQTGGKQDVNFSVPATAQVSTVNAQVGFGIQGKNLCVVEDDLGNVVFSAYTAKELAGSTTDVCRVLDADNNLMNMPLGFPLKSNYQGKSLGIKKPGSSNIYYLITVGTDQRAYYHEINVTTKEVSPNHLIDPTGTNYGYGMALIEDNSGNASSKLFLRKHNADNTVDIVCVAITQSGFGTSEIVDNFPGRDLNGKGEIQISPDGTQLAIANQKANYGWWAADGEIRMYNLDLNHEITGLSTAYSIGNRSVLQSFDFTPLSKSVYYSEVKIGKLLVGGSTTTKGIYKLDIDANQITEVMANVAGDVRRTKDQKIYIAQASGESLNKINNPDGSFNVSSFALASYPWKITGGIPLQPIKILALDESILTRELANKTYEINDHLGNVRAVISDIKLLEGSMPIVEGLYWNFDTSDNEVNGSGINPNVNSSVVITGENGSPAIEVGTSKNIAFPDNPILDFGDEDFTICVWAKKISQLSWGNSIINKWNTGGVPGTNEWSLGFGSGQFGSPSNIGFSIESGTTHYSAIGTTSLVSNQWYFIVGKREGDYLRVYVDGNFEGETYIGNVSVNNVSGRVMQIGRLGVGNYSNFGVDDLRIYNQAISDEQIQWLYEGNTTLSDLAFEPDVVSTNNYYAFGSLMPGRNYSSGDYRFGFNGKEMDNEVKGVTGSQQDYGFRSYDTRIGKFFSIDPLANEYPYYTPYQFAGNTPIQAIDRDGLEEYHFTLDKGSEGQWNVVDYKKVESIWLKSLWTGKYVAKEFIANYKGETYIFRGKDAKTQFGAFLLNPDNPKILTEKQSDRLKDQIEGVYSGMLGITKLLGSNVKNPIPNKKENKPGTYAPKKPLSRDKNGNAIPDSEATGSHTQLGTKKGRNGDYTQAREFDKNGKPVKDIDFTDHGRPQNHSNPHQHEYKPNPTGGTPQRSKTPKPLN